MTLTDTTNGEHNVLHEPYRSDKAQIRCKCGREWGSTEAPAPMFDSPALAILYGLIPDMDLEFLSRTQGEIDQAARVGAPSVTAHDAFIITSFCASEILRRSGAKGRVDGLTWVECTEHEGNYWAREGGHGCPRCTEMWSP